MRLLPWLLALGCARPAFEVREVPDLVLARVVAGQETESLRPWRAYAAMHLWTHHAEEAA